MCLHWRNSLKFVLFRSYQQTNRCVRIQHKITTKHCICCMLFRFISFFWSIHIESTTQSQSEHNPFSSVENISVENISLENISVENNSVENIYVENISFENISIENISVENISVGNISVENISVENISAENISVENISVENISVENISVVNILVFLNKLTLNKRHELNCKKRNPIKFLVCWRSK